MLPLCNFLLWGHREQDAPDKNKNTETHKDSKVRQELYRANRYGKPRQDAGVFLLLEFKLYKRLQFYRFIQRNTAQHKH
ncbi:hypothetical protein BEN74_01465 [Acinetobacter sp. WCHAc010034]|nr:hypothetical protein BEN74_01465 [Acinetobacter sp. WCHAc010034]